MSIVVNSRIRLLFEIDHVDLRIDPLEKEEMMNTIQPHTSP